MNRLPNAQDATASKRSHRAARFVAMVVLAVACLGQSASLMMDPNVKRAGMKLACLCTSCRNTVGDCQMMGCSYASGARQRILQMQTVGASDEQVIAKFVSEQGTKALSTPPASGFNLAAWLMPGVVLLVGLYAVLVAIKRLRRPVIAGPATVSARHQKLAAEELENFE